MACYPQYARRGCPTRLAESEMVYCVVGCKEENIGPLSAGTAMDLGDGKRCEKLD